MHFHITRSCPVLAHSLANRPEQGNDLTLVSRTEQENKKTRKPEKKPAGKVGKSSHRPVVWIANFTLYGCHLGLFACVSEERTSYSPSRAKSEWQQRISPSHPSITHSTHLIRCLSWFILALHSHCCEPGFLLLDEYVVIQHEYSRSFSKSAGENKTGRDLLHRLCSPSSNRWARTSASASTITRLSMDLSNHLLTHLPTRPTL